MVPRRCLYGARNGVTGGVTTRGSVDAMFCEVVAQGALADPHRLSRVLLDAGGCLEGAAGGLPFDPVDVLPEVQGGQNGRRRGGWREDAHRIQSDHGNWREHDRPLDGVLE